jgi:hypothetical protein
MFDTKLLGFQDISCILCLGILFKAMDAGGQLWSKVVKGLQAEAAESPSRDGHDVVWDTL